MNQHIAGFVIALTSLVSSAPLLHASPTEQSLGQKRNTPNILVILADDLGYGDLTCYNDASKAPTPHLDALARAGIRFTDGHSNSAVCTPSRYGLLTGRYAWRTRMKRGVLNGMSAPLIAKDRETIATLAKKKNYHTACFGKWHLGLGWVKSTSAKKHSIDFTKELTDSPVDHGFDYFYGIAASLDMPPYVWIENRKVTALPTETTAPNPGPLAYWRGGKKAPDFKFEQGLPQTAQKAADFIQRQSPDQPFLMYVAFPSPHKPVLPLPKFKGKSEAGDYGDYVVETDWAVGKIIDALKKKNLYDNTLVIFTSDNGSFANMPRYGVLKFGHSPCGVLRGGKTDIWDGGHRVPFIASWPKGITPNQIYDGTISTTDILATVSDVIGEPLPSQAGVDSWSFADVFQSGKSKNRNKPRIFHSIHGMFALRKDDWKWIDGKGSGGRGGKGKKSDLAGQLYNMKDDISEKNNLIAQHPEVVKSLNQELHQIIKKGRSTPVVK